MVPNHARVSRFHSLQQVVHRLLYYVPQRSLSLTPEFKSRFHFPLIRLDQILDGTYPVQDTWMSKWKAYLKQFHKLKITQIKDMLHVCAKRRVVPLDLWRELQSVHWAGKLSEAKGSEVASVLHSLALLNQSRQLTKGRVRTEPFTESVLKQALQRKDLDQFTNIGLSQCLYSFALLELSGHPVIPLYSAEISKSHRQTKLTPQSLANVLWSWAKLSHTEASHVAALAAEAVKKKHLANEQELTNVLWAWSLLGHISQEHWRAMMDEMKRRRALLTGQGLSLVFLACARVGHQDSEPSETLLQHMTESKKHVLFSNLILANLVWSFGKLDMRRDSPSVLAFLSEALKVSRLEKYTSQELCCLTVGVSLLDHQDLDHCVRLHMEIMKPRRLTAFNPQELCNLIWALGKMSVQSTECQKSLAAEVVGRRDSFEQFTCQGLSSVVLGWAHCGFSRKEDSNIVLREVMKQDRLKHYNPQELANLCWSFGRLGIHSANLYTRLADRMLVPDTVQAFTPQALANILVGWAHGRFCDLPALDALTAELRGEKLRGLKTQELANVCWALGKLKYRSGDVVKRIAMEAAQASRLAQFSPLQLSIILLGWSKSEMHAFRLWDRLLAEFSSRQETVVVDMPVLHHLTLAVQNVGFKGLNDYRTAREQGRFLQGNKSE